MRQKGINLNSVKGDCMNWKKHWHYLANLFPGKNRLNPGPMKRRILIFEKFCSAMMGKRRRSFTNDIVSDSSSTIFQKFIYSLICLFQNAAKGNQFGLRERWVYELKKALTLIDWQISFQARIGWIQEGWWGGYESSKSQPWQEWWVSAYNSNDNIGLQFSFNLGN